MLQHKLFAHLASCLVGGAALVTIAPWLNPCIGAMRFSECVDPLSDPEGRSLVSWCYLGVCDSFPTVLGIALRVLAVLSVLVGSGVLVGRIVNDRRLLHGATAAGLTLVVGAASITFLYPYGAT